MVERSLTPVPIEKGRIANLSVGFVENDPKAPHKFVKTIRWRACDEIP